MAERWCSHCDLAPSRRTNGLCDACNSYLGKLGRLPSQQVIRRRVERAVETDLERKAHTG